MKTLKLIIPLLAVSLAASAQRKHENISESIHEDGSELKIDISGKNNGRNLDYHRSFNVKGMSKAQKDAIIKKVTDSLGLAPHTEPGRPQVPQPPAPPASVTSTKSSSTHLDSDIHDDGKTMQVRISGNKGKGTFSYSKNFNVKGMSKADKDALIKHITDSLGVSDRVNTH